MELVSLVASIVIFSIITFLLPLNSKHPSRVSVRTKFDDWEELSPDETLKNAKYVSYGEEEKK